MNRRTDRVVGALGFLGSVVVLRLLAGSHPGPFVTDEAGYLGNARWLAGTGGRWLMDTSPFYRWGYSVLLVPTQWLTDDPETQFRLVTAVNLALLGALFPILYTLLRRTLDPPPWAAAVAAGVAVAATPGWAPRRAWPWPRTSCCPCSPCRSSPSSPSPVARAASAGGSASSSSASGPATAGSPSSWRCALLAIAVAVWADRRRLRAGLVNAGVLVLGFVPVTLVDHALVEGRGGCASAAPRSSAVGRGRCSPRPATG